MTSYFLFVRELFNKNPIYGGNKKMIFLVNRIRLTHF